MYSPVQLGFSYLRYYITASNGKGHGVHSPFVFEFITRVLNDDREFYAYQQIENLRQLLLADTRSLMIEDFGAGSRTKGSDVRTVAAIAGSSLKPVKYGQLLFRIVHHYAPGTILELGTSLGITTAYLAAAGTDARVVTMEGAMAVAEMARSNFKKLLLENIQVVEGDFDHTLAATLDAIGQLDFVFIDGNHRYAPTIRYFRQMLPKTHEYSILIFDDIHWSKEMEQAWEEIKKEERVTLSIDLFFIGLVFFRKEHKVKQDMIIRF
ncbi:MAG: class I SAM-dependent methyltransferase [Sediminibacterium sp.]